MDKVAKSLDEAEERLGIFESPVSILSPADLARGISCVSTRLSVLSGELKGRTDKSTSKWFIDLCAVCKDPDAVPDNMGMCGCGQCYCTGCVNQLDFCEVCNKKMQIQKLSGLTHK